MLRKEWLDHFVIYISKTNTGTKLEKCWLVCTEKRVLADLNKLLGLANWKETWFIAWIYEVVMFDPVINHLITLNGRVN